ncbi:MAG: hypothetical protein NXH95_04035 [Pseudomonadaceae bacterium]|nr:hypothetical protein [Pseudomonadaceae bacterium]
MFARFAAGSILLILLGACTDTSEPLATVETSDAQAPNLSKAEAFIDAFYSFDPERLRPMLMAAPESAQSILYYQGWAEGGNYKVLERGACAVDENKLISCPITVQDDPVMALNTGFNVTDTFTLTFANGEIVKVETSSNDQPIYYEARAWVEREMPEVMAGPCKDRGTAGSTPGDCARAMTEGYRRFAASDAYSL